jgi:polar amino acid transport system substrate-binding protein
MGSAGGREHPARRRVLALVVAGAAIAALAGCAAAGVTRTGAAGQAAARQATAGAGSDRPGVTEAAARTTRQAPAAASCNPYASLAPQAGGPSVTAGSFAATIRARGYLIAGIDQSTYNWGYLNPLNGQIEGFDIDMIKDVAAAIFGESPSSQALLAHIHFKVITDPRRIPDLQKRTVDIVAFTMTVNCARMQLVDFSSIYYDAKQRVLVDRPASGPAPDLAQLGARHEKVCAPAGSDSVNHIEAAHATVVTVTYMSDCLVLLEEGQVAGISTDDSILYGLEAQDPDTTVTGPPLEDEPYGLAISKAHPDFVQFVNAVLAADGVDKSSGLWADSYRQWVSATAAIPAWPLDYVGLILRHPCVDQPTGNRGFPPRCQPTPDVRDRVLDELQRDEIRGSHVTVAVIDHVRKQ